MCVNLFFFVTVHRPYRISSLITLLKSTQVGDIFIFCINLFCPCYAGKELPQPIWEPDWQLCDCSECGAEHQLASPIEDLWIWDMPGTVFRHGVLADSKHGQIKPMSACRIPQSFIFSITPLSGFQFGFS